MAQKQNFYDEQLVGVNELSTLQDAALNGIKEVLTSLLAQGIVSGMTISPTAPAPTMGIVVADGKVALENGAFVVPGVATTIDLSAITVAAAGNSKWVAVYAVPLSRSDTPVIVPVSGATVQYRTYDYLSYVLVVGAEALNPVKPTAAPAGGFTGILLGDVKVVYGAASIGADKIDLARAQQWSTLPSIGLFFKQNGLPPWYPDLPYVQGSRVSGDDGKSYISLQNNNVGHPPSTSPVYWMRWGFTAAEAGVRYSYDLSVPPAAPILLQPGDRMALTFANVTSIPLFVTSVEGMYRLTVLLRTGAVNIDFHLLPNDRQYAGAFGQWIIESTDAGASSENHWVNPAPVVAGIPTGQDDMWFDFFSGPFTSEDTINSVPPAIADFIVSTYTNAKAFRCCAGNTGGPAIGFAKWNDTVIPWTSLGTVNFGGGSTPCAGTIFIERLV